MLTFNAGVEKIACPLTPDNVDFFMANGNPMAKALKIASQFGNEYDILYLQKQFERLQQMPNASRMFFKIASALDKEQLEDYLAEVRYALVFAGLGFQVEIEPDGIKGPDLKISRDDHQAIVEVTRFRKIHPGPSKLALSDENLRLPIYGNPLRDIRKAFDKLLSKFPQVEGEQAIIAIWNDDGDLEEGEVKTAINALCNDAERGILSLPHCLLFILYSSPWVRTIDHKQLYCFPLRHLDQPDQITWQSEFERFTVREYIQRALTQQTGKG
ncbi:MAG: hypothetical protein AB1502_02785 [Thermodesulfobacteriota bacterium]